MRHLAVAPNSNEKDSQLITMPITTLSGIIAIFLYLLATGLHANMIKKSGTARTQAGMPVLLVGGLGALMQLTQAWFLMVKADGYHFGVIEVSVLISAALASIALITNARRPLGALILGVLPVTALVALLSLLFQSHYPPQRLAGDVFLHILVSVLAYSFATLAALQSAFLAFQNYQLRNHHPSAVIRRFPPLQDMEKLLFELLWLTEVLLTVGIVAGFAFAQDWSEQGLIHKMFFSILAWLVFAVLLWGRHQLGWRGNTAIRGTLAGFVCLLLGFYGSKAVIEFILGG
jgi:ABC-type uncharacterized transport system permease subunit